MLMFPDVYLTVSVIPGTMRGGWSLIHTQAAVEYKGSGKIAENYWADFKGRIREESIVGLG